MHEDVIRSLSEHAARLFDSREMYCAQAILTALDEGLRGGLGRSNARRLAAGFGEGLGKAGCVCGALSGAVLAASWFLCDAIGPAGVRQVSRELHGCFREAHNSSCCRVLTKPVADDSCRHFEKCSGLTRHAAQLAAQAILAHRPELAQDEPHLPRPNRLASLLRRLADAIS